MLFSRKKQTMQDLSIGDKKMKRTIAVIVIILIIALICILEELVVKNVTTTFSSQTQALYEQISNNNSNINTKEIVQDYNNLNAFWEKEKHKLCYLTNYDKIRNIDESMSRLNYAILNNDFSLAIDNISIIISFGNFLHYFMGFNINNLF